MAADDFFPGYAHTVTEIGKERGWPAVTRRDFDAQRGPQGALLIGDPDEVVEESTELIAEIALRLRFAMN